jgi:hypothetical protein
MTSLAERCAAWTDSDMSSIPDQRQSGNAWQQRGPPSYIVSRNNGFPALGGGGATGDDSKTVASATSASTIGGNKGGNATVATQMTDMSTIETMITERATAIQQELRNHIDLQIQKAAEYNQCNIDKLNTKVDEASNQIASLSQSLSESITNSVTESTNSRFQTLEASARQMQQIMETLTQQVSQGFAEARQTSLAQQHQQQHYVPDQYPQQWQQGPHPNQYNHGGGNHHGPYQQQYQHQQAPINYNHQQQIHLNTTRHHQNQQFPHTPTRTQEQNQSNEATNTEELDDANQYDGGGETRADDNTTNASNNQTQDQQTAPVHRKAANDTPPPAQETQVSNQYGSRFQTMIGYHEQDDAVSTASTHWLIDRLTGERLEYAPMLDAEYLRMTRQDLGFPEWPAQQEPPYVHYPPPYHRYSVYGRSHPYYETAQLSPHPYWDPASVIAQERIHYATNAQVQNFPSTPDSALISTTSTDYFHSPTPPPSSITMDDRPSNEGALFSPAFVETAEDLASRFESQANNIEASGQEPGGETE